MRVVLGLLAAMAAAPALAAEVEAALDAPAEVEPWALGCRRAFGFAVGAFDRTTGEDWDTVGSAPWGPTITPVFGAYCGGEGARTYASIGVETAPWFIHINIDGEIRRQWASTTGALLFGPPALRVGVHGTFGYTALGGGLAAMWSPAKDEANRAAIEVRLSADHVGAPGLQAMMLYTTTPKRRFREGS